MTKKTHEKFIQEVEVKFGKNTYTIIGKYVNCATKISIKHNICDYKWNVIPNNLLQGQSKCPNCSGKKTLTTEEFSRIVYEITEGEYLLTGEYINANTLTTIKHLDCGIEFNVTPNNFKNHNYRCSRCNCMQSKGEYEIVNFCESHNIKYDIQYCLEGCKDKKLLPFDFVIFNQNGELVYLIEYDGQQHFKPIDFAGRGEDWANEQYIELQKRDEIKNKFCNDNNINLLRIPYWEFNNIEQILSDFLKLNN